MNELLSLAVLVRDPREPVDQVVGHLREAGVTESIRVFAPGSAPRGSHAGVVFQSLPNKTELRAWRRALIGSLRVPSNWVLFLDSRARLRPETMEYLRSLVQKPPADPAVYTLCNPSPAVNPYEATQIWVDFAPRPKSFWCAQALCLSRQTIACLTGQPFLPTGLDGRLHTWLGHVCRAVRLPIKAHAFGLADVRREFRSLGRRRGRRLND